MRLFIGIPLPSNVSDVLKQTVKTVQTPVAGLRWTSPESWHITLQFLGTTAAEQLNCVSAQLAAIRSSPVPVILEGMGCFDRAGVFFAGIDVSPELRELQEHVVAAASKCGFVPEERRYHPHVTLARAKGDHARQGFVRLTAKANTVAKFPAFTAREFLLYEAFLGAGGSRYEVRERFPFAGQT
jgi:2'-5' RNA ligase